MQVKHKWKTNSHLQQIDALFALGYPHDPYFWKKYLCPTGGVEAYIAEGRKDPVAPYLSEHVRIPKIQIAYCSRKRADLMFLLNLLGHASSQGRI